MAADIRCPTRPSPASRRPSSCSPQATRPRPVGLQRALGFYRQVKASAYLREGEALVAASA
jgi:hypothetical protein